MLALYLFEYKTGAFNFRGEYFYVYGIPCFVDLFNLFHKHDMIH